VFSVKQGLPNIASVFLSFLLNLFYFLITYSIVRQEEISFVIKRAISPKIEVQSQKETAVLRPQGLWLSKTAADMEAVCIKILRTPLPQKISIDLSDFLTFDTAGIWLLENLMAALRDRKHSLTLQNANKRFSTLSTYLLTHRPSVREEAPSLPFLKTYLTHIGQSTLNILFFAQALITFIGQVTCAIGRTLFKPHRLRTSAIVAQMEKAGVDAIPIIFVMSLALGLVLAYQGEEQLRRFGAEIYTINLVSISIVREVGILITAILVAGRTGSAMTAHLGIMKMNQEIDALNTLGLDPMEALIIPRILALVIIMPCLAFISDIGGLLGGGIMVVESLGVSPELYIQRVGEAVTLGGFWIGILKAPVFGAIIGIVSCFEGLQVKKTAESIGKCTTRSVVEGIFLVTLVDAILSVFFSKIGL